MKKSIKCLPVLVTALSVASCGGGGKTSGSASSAAPVPTNPTVVNITHYEGTGTKETPTTWVERAAERFAAAHYNDSYEEGKQGIKFTFTYEKNFSTVIYPTLETNASDIFIDERFVDTYAYNANMMDLTDVVKPLVDANKLDANALKRCVSPEAGKEGKYYSIPFYEWFSGISYDVQLFKEKLWYFADPNESNYVEYTTNFGDIKLIGDISAKKSVGPDGVRDTSDDGLPSSLEELVKLCDHIKEDNRDSFPVIIATSASQYSFYLVQALWASLAGNEKMQNIYCNYTDAQIEVVTGYTNEPIWDGVDIYKPTTEFITLNDTNGYRMYDMVERYYALAFLQLLMTESKKISSSGLGWLNKDAQTEAKGAQDSFIYNPVTNKKYAMLYDSSYWYHEDIDTINKYEKSTKQKRDVSYMPLPTQLTGQVTEGNGKKNTLLDLGSTYIFANKKTETNFPGRAKAVKEFLSFIYTDEELNNFTNLTGLTVPAEYGYSSKDAALYYQHMAQIKSESNVIHYASSNERFVKNLTTFNVSFGGPIQSVDGDMSGYISYMLNHENQESAKQIFEATKRSSATWPTING